MTLAPQINKLNAALYITIAMGGPLGEYFISDRPITYRSLTAVTIVSIVAAANALKAFLSQSKKEEADESAPTPVSVVSDSLNPVITQEVKKIEEVKP